MRLRLNVTINGNVNMGTKHYENLIQDYLNVGNRLGPLYGSLTFFSMLARCYKISAMKTIVN